MTRNAAEEILFKETTEEMDEARLATMNRLRDGDYDLMYSLFKIAWEPDYSDQEREIALDILACVEIPEASLLAELLIKRYLTETVNTGLRFEAIAACGMISQEHVRARFYPALKLIAKSSNKRLAPPARAAIARWEN